MEQPVVIEQGKMDIENDLITQVGRLIIINQRYQNDEWVSLAVVYEMENGSTGKFGYYFRADGSWKPEIPKGFESSHKMLELQAAMERRTGKKWLRALVHIDRVKQDINIIFEYDDPTRWQIRPNDLEASINALRPENN